MLVIDRRSIIQHQHPGVAVFFVFVLWAVARLVVEAWWSMLMVDRRSIIQHQHPDEPILGIDALGVFLDKNCPATTVLKPKKRIAKTHTPTVMIGMQ